jgi:hypothetical protein
MRIRITGVTGVYEDWVNEDWVYWCMRDVFTGYWCVCGLGLLVYEGWVYWILVCA